jgi:Pyridoxamine 5'-phosphate oxidase
MDIREREGMARAIVDGNGYMTLGTADADGLPWVSPVWYAPASYREFFWVSKPGATHSQNIAVRPEVAIVIFDSTVPVGTGKAVYMAARAQEVTDAGDVDRGMAVLSARSVARRGDEWTPGTSVRSPGSACTARWRPSSSCCRRRTSGCHSAWRRCRPSGLLLGASSDRSCARCRRLHALGATSSGEAK